MGKIQRKDAAQQIIDKIGKRLFSGEWHKYPKKAQDAAEYLLREGLTVDDVELVIGAIFEDAKEQYGD
jgi:hypothetical protein